MKILVLSGADAMGTVTVRDLTKSPTVRPKPFFAKLSRRSIKMNKTTETPHTL